MIDFLVIGGGIAGLSAGAHLSANGKVLLLEQENALGYHASGRSAALFEPNYGNAPVRALSRASEDAHRAGGYLSPRGFLLLGNGEDDAQFERDLAALGCDEITISNALDFVPILNRSSVARAAYHAGAEDIDTDRLLQDFARIIRKNGGEILVGSQVTKIQRTSSCWVVDANGTEYETHKLLNAAGPWADVIATMAGIKPVGLTPFRRSMARIAAPDGLDLSLWPMFFGTGETWYAKPDAGQLIVSPAEEHAVAPMDAWPEDMVLAEGLARYQDMVIPEVSRPTATWAGLRTFAPDRTLVLGPDVTDPDFVWSAGQGGYGFQTGPAAGALVGDLTIGRTPQIHADIVAQLSPARFR